MYHRLVYQPRCMRRAAPWGGLWTTIEVAKQLKNG
jgi:hypothetical protein